MELYFECVTNKVGGESWSNYNKAVLHLIPSGLGDCGVRRSFLISLSEKRRQLHLFYGAKSAEEEKLLLVFFCS